MSRGHTLPGFREASRDYRNWVRELLRDDLDRFTTGSHPPGDSLRR